VDESTTHDWLFSRRPKKEAVLPTAKVNHSINREKAKAIRKSKTRECSRYEISADLSKWHSDIRL
jgi:hypothetical protein